MQPLQFAPKCQWPEVFTLQERMEQRLLRRLSLPLRLTLSMLRNLTLLNPQYQGQQVLQLGVLKRLHRPAQSPDADALVGHMPC